MKVVSVIWAILRGLLWALADEFPLGGRRQPSAEKKESPWWAERPEAARPASGAAEQPASQTARPHEASAPPCAAPAWWPEPAAPVTPPTIKVETDAGSFVARATFSGHHALGVRPVERPRADGESRRHRRPARSVAPREPSVPEPAPSPVMHADVAVDLCEPAVPVEPAPVTRTEVRQLAKVEGAPADGAAALIDPSEAPRVARARRVRCRFGADTRPGQNLLATTLATRLALTASTSGSSPSTRAAVREGDSA